MLPIGLEFVDYAENNLRSYYRFIFRLEISITISCLVWGSRAYIISFIESGDKDEEIKYSNIILMISAFNKILRWNIRKRNREFENTRLIREFRLSREYIIRIIFLILKKLFSSLKF